MILSDLFSLATDLASADNPIKKKVKNLWRTSDQMKGGKRSIKNRTKNLILQYPVLTSNSISADTVQTVARALEHEYVNILTILINSEIHHTIDSDENADTSSYLKKYHTNIYRNSGLVESDSTIRTQLTKANQELLESFEGSLNLENLNSLSFPNSILVEAKSNQDDPESKRELEKRIRELEREKKEYENNISKMEKNHNREVEKLKRYGGNGASIDKVETKKLNDMTPTIVKSIIKIKDKDTKQIFEKQISFGVKAVIHPLESSDCVYYLSDSVTDTNKFFRLIQWTTGEIKFFRDLIASIDTVKKTAVTANEKGGTFWWRKLSSMAKDSLLRRLFGKKGEPIPTATLVISKQDVDAIKNSRGIDLLNTPGHAKTIMKKFFLLGFVIVDESIQIAYIYNEVSKDYDYYTFNALKDFGKENTTDMDVAKSLMRGR